MVVMSKFNKIKFIQCNKMSKIYEFKAERRNLAGSRMQDYPMDFLITEIVFIFSPFIFNFFGDFSTQSFKKKDI
jgi:hypothetical protein